MKNGMTYYRVLLPEPEISTAHTLFDIHLNEIITMVGSLFGSPYFVH